jgi:hypothetical protein
MYVQRGTTDYRGDWVPSDEPDAVRAGYRCRAAACGWREWLMWFLP